MFERIRASLSRAVGRRSRHPAPVLEDGTAAREVRLALEAFLATSAERYARFFLDDRPLHIARGDEEHFSFFASAGLATAVGGRWWMPLARVIPFEGMFIAADLRSHRDPDQVFSPMFEQVYVARRMAYADSDDLLEIGAGSGVLSIRAARAARHVTAVDLHERALAFAAFNRDLNGATKRVDLERGSLFQPLEADRRYDVILTNPPFEPVPPGETYFHHSAGGADGLDLVRAILAEAPQRLTPGGRFEIVTWSPGAEDRSRLEDLLQEAFPAHAIEVDVLDVWPIENHLRRFASAPGYAGWCAGLAADGLTHLHFLFARVTPATTASLVRHHPAEEVATCHAKADLWA